MKIKINLLLPVLFLSTSYLQSMDNKKFVDPIEQALNILKQKHPNGFFVSINQEEEPQPEHEEKTEKNNVTSNYQELDETHYKMVYESAPEEFKEIIENQKEAIPLINNAFLYGPAGTGKTSLGLAAALILKRPYFILDAANTRTKFVASSPNNFLKKLTPFLENKEKLVIIIDEFTALTNGKNEATGSKEDVMGIWKTLDSCFKALHLFFVLTTNDPSKMPRPLKDRVLNSAIEITTPPSLMLAEVLIQKCKNATICSLDQETENYIKSHPDLSFASYRNVESFLNQILLKIKYQNRSNVQNKSPITKILIDSIIERNKKNLRKLDYFAPDISEQERLHEDNKEFQKKLQDAGFKKQEQLAQEQKEFQLLSLEKQEEFSLGQYNQSAKEEMAQQFSSSVPLVGSFIGSHYRSELRAEELIKSSAKEGAQYKKITEQLSNLTQKKDNNEN